MTNFVFGLMYVLASVVCFPIVRAAYSIQSTGLDGKVVTFNRPFFMEFVMFFAMALILFVELARRCLNSSRPKDTLMNPLVHDVQNEATTSAPLTRRSVLILAIPAALDLLASWFVFAAPLWIPASVAQMLTAFGTVFSALLAVGVLKRKLSRMQILGVAVVVSGLVIVGGFSVKADEQSGEAVQFSSDFFLGLVFMVVGELCYAIEFTTCEYLQQGEGLPPLLSVGLMGVWGLVFFVFLYPILMFTPNDGSANASLWHENFVDSFTLLVNSSSLTLVLCGACVCLFFLNIAMIKVTQLMSALSLSLLGCLVFPAVWAMDLVFGALKVVAGNSEQWSVWCWGELCGCALIIVGTLLYQGLFEKISSSPSEKHST